MRHGSILTSDKARQDKTRLVTRGIATKEIFQGWDHVTRNRGVDLHRKEKDDENTQWRMLFTTHHLRHQNPPSRLHLRRSILLHRIHPHHNTHYLLLLSTHH